MHDLKGWVYEKLGNLPILFIDSDRSKRYPKRSEFQDHGIAFLNAESISSGRFDRTKVNHIPYEKYEEIKKGRVENGDIVLTMRGNGVGDAALIFGEGILGLINAQMLILRPNDEVINSKFLYYGFISPQFKRELSNFVSGSAQPQLTMTHLRHVPFRVPPLAEQKAIAHILGSLDEKIELNRQMNETLEAMAQALFKSWFVDFDPVIDNALAAGNAIPDELAERAEQRKTIEKKENSDIQGLFPDEFEFTEEMGWIPKGWQAVRFADITEAKQGRYLASNKMTDLPDDKHIYPVWGGNEVRGFSEDLLFDSPVVVLTCRGSNCGLLKITEAESWVTNSSFACTPKFGSAYFIYIYFSNDDFSQSISGSAQPQITYTALKNNLMKFPISEKVVENLSMRLEVLRSKQIFCQKQSKTLAKLRETLLPKLMSGDLRISDAAELLDEVL